MVVVRRASDLDSYRHVLQQGLPTNQEANSSTGNNNVEITQWPRTGINNVKYKRKQHWS